ncbi:ribonuclease P/MRP protein subunit POP5 isoform X1 [Rhinopithecus roxellana]|uniref:ribonuclease P/MRP protein subunit POP5 isoform X1 n=1 Tax=Rhinopithecus roxellana TaxID=61622 RepID=UPI000533070B|nr:ribonuclease P/MRP protein subunit POP5 isoform X1 [Rhinopithecus roxellana]XP_017727601.1 PREDICTED: ribonuclease P/MRP protein subunit POP5 isoform X1 [Rhinopithecus bieti]
MVRFKHRYLLCELVSDDPRCRLSLDDRVLSSLVRDTIARVHGTFGAAACSIGFAVRYLNAYTGIVLLRCRKEFCQLVWSALPFITCLENKGHRYPCFFNTLHVGVCKVETFHKLLTAVTHMPGTIRTCQKFLIQYNRRQLLILLQNCTDEGEREAIQKSVTRSCLLEEEEESGEEAAEAME